jgi:hypothetical protein
MEKHSTPVIHLNWKPSNIFMDDHFCKTKTEFGLSRLFGGEQNVVSTTNVVGSI